jgi:hypothetical protein
LHTGFLYSRPVNGSVQVQEPCWLMPSSSLDPVP